MEFGYRAVFCHMSLLKHIPLYMPEPESECRLLCPLQLSSMLSPICFLASTIYSPSWIFFSFIAFKTNTFLDILHCMFALPLGLVIRR